MRFIAFDHLLFDETHSQMDTRGIERSNLLMEDRGLEPLGDDCTF
jgi:hypothetical protein